MANEQNLRPSAYKFTHEDSVKGGKKSVESRRKRKAFSDAFETLLQKDFTDNNGNQITGVEAVALKTFQRAMNGDLKAMQIIRDTVGEMPIQRVETVNIEPETYERVQDILESFDTVQPTDTIEKKENGKS